MRCAQQAHGSDPTWCDADGGEDTNFETDIAAVLAALAPASHAAPPRPPTDPRALELQLRVATGQAEHHRAESGARATQIEALQAEVERLQQEAQSAADAGDALLPAAAGPDPELQLLRVCAALAF